MTIKARKPLKTGVTAAKRTSQGIQALPSVKAALWVCIRFLSPLRDPRQGTLSREVWP